MSRQPPPRPISTLSRLFATSRISARWRSSAWRAPYGSVVASTCTCARISGAVLEVSKPPHARTSFAMYDAAATTEGSSTTIGTSTSRPLTTKFAATPIGSSKVPITFSIMPSASASASAPGWLSSARSSALSEAA